MTDNHFIANGQPVCLTMAGYMDWFARNERIGTIRSSVMEYSVGKLLTGLESPNGALYRMCDNDMPLTNDGIRVSLRWTEWHATADPSARNAVSLPVRFSKWPDVVIFGLHDTAERWHPVLDLDAWDYYSISGSILSRAFENAENISLPGLLKLGPVWSDYNGIPDALSRIVGA